VGLEMAARAGYQPQASVELWKKMMAANGGGGPGFLSTHPAGPDRIHQLEANVPKVQGLYEQATGAGLQQQAVANQPNVVAAVGEASPVLGAQLAVLRAPGAVGVHLQADPCVLDGAVNHLTGTSVVEPPSEPQAARVSKAAPDSASERGLSRISMVSLQ
jgi:hypothetical protein